MDALDHKLSTEINDIKKMLISLHKQLDSSNNKSSSSEPQIRVRTSDDYLSIVASCEHGLRDYK